MSKTMPSTTPKTGPFSSSRPLLRRLGWSLCLICSAFHLAYPLLAVRVNNSSATGLTVYMLALITLILLPIGAALLMAGYPDFFHRPQGFLLWAGMLFALLFIENRFLSGELPPALVGIVNCIQAWEITAGLLFGPALGLYMLGRDHSLRVFALTLLLGMGLLFAAGQRVGWPEMLRGIATGGSGWLLAGLMCLFLPTMSISLLAFVWHTLVSIRREFSSQ